MSVLDDLIKIKANMQEDDLIKLLDEIPVYDKLSVDEQLKDLKKSTITRTKCPLLAGFADGKLYETILADLAANVYLQIEGNIPEVLTTAAEKTLRQQKQMEILHDSIARVEYRELTEYDHNLMKDYLAAVFTKQDQNIVTAVLIVKELRNYIMYHGTYIVEEYDKFVINSYIPLTTKGERGIFTMYSYSVLGNNGYRFGSYLTSNKSYDVMIGPDGVLYLLNGELVTSHSITSEEHNNLNMAKRDPQKFAETVTAIIESVV